MLQVSSASHAGPLAARLAEVLAAPLPDPMEPDWVAVPSEGMRRWLSLELARHLGADGPSATDGVTANITSAFPGSLRRTVLEAAADTEEDPWAVGRMVWPVLARLRDAGDDPLLAPLAAVDDGASLYTRARRIADLFDRYHLHRPAMVRAWAEGDDVDGRGAPVAPHHRWQPHLWREVRSAMGTPSPAEQLPEALARLRRGELELELPGRLAFFGLTVLPGGARFLDLVTAVATQHDVHLLLLDPSPGTSTRIREHADASEGVGLRVDDPTVDLVSHPLLRSWGRLPRETTTLLARGAARGEVPPPQPLTPRDTTSRTTLLHRLQHDLRTGAVPAADLVPAATDRSLQIHACHGPARQVEVLRDALLHALAADPTLSEDDILVICPALDVFVPLVEATFGPSAERGPPSSGPHPPALRYRIADRSLRQVNPLSAALEQVLALVTGRFDAVAVLDLVALPAVRQRYGLSDEEVAVMGDWAAETNVRWGLDPEHRRPFGVPASITTNTWRAATDRLLVGAAVDDTSDAFALGGVVPFGIEGDDVTTAGKLADLLHRLALLAEVAQVPRPLEAWLELVRQAATDLLAPARDQEWQRDALDRALGEAADDARTGGGEATPLTFVDLRRLLSERLVAGPGRADFLRGGITLTSAHPLRWVPHRVIVLLGLDQAALSGGSIDGDDLVAAQPLLGDPDPRGEGRLSVLEAVLAAEDQLLVLRDGHDVRTNQPVPRSVITSELRDAARGVVAEEATEAVDAWLEVHHPRQPYDERCLTPGGLPGTAARTTPWSFDPAARDAAEARRSRAATAAPFLVAPLARPRPAVIDLADLHAFLKDPTRTFLTESLGLRLPRDEDPLPSRLPVEVVALDEWKVGDRLLATLLDGGSTDDWAARERAIGTLPPGVLGDAKVADVVEKVDALVALARRHGLVDGHVESHPVEVVLDDGTRVVGTVEGALPPATPGPARITYSKAKPIHRLAAWLDLVVATASDPGRDWRSLAVSRNDRSAKAEAADLVVSGGRDGREERARIALGLVVDLHRRGLCEPLPLFPTTSERVWQGRSAAGEWSRPGGYGEGQKPPVRAVYGDVGLRDLLALPVEPHDPPGPGDNRLRRYAALLWDAFEASTETHAPDGEAPS